MGGGGVDSMEWVCCFNVARGEELLTDGKISFSPTLFSPLENVFVFLCVCLFVAFVVECIIVTNTYYILAVYCSAGALNYMKDDRALMELLFTALATG